LFTDNGTNAGYNNSGVAARTFIIQSTSGRPISLEVIENANVHAVYIYPNNSGFNRISSDYMSGGVFLPLSLTGRENNADLVLQTNGNITIGTTSDSGFKLDVNGISRIGNLANSSVADSLFLHGKGVTSVGIPYGDYGSIVLGADSSYTSGARRFLITNGYNATRFAIIQSTDSNTTPTLGEGGVVSSGTLIFSISNTGNAEFSVPLIGTSATFSTTVTATDGFFLPSANVAGVRYLVAGENTNTGTTGRVMVLLQNSANSLVIEKLSTGFTSSGVRTQAGSAIYDDGAGGMSIGATNVSGSLRLFTGNTGRMTIDASGRVITTVSGINGQLQVFQSDASYNSDAMMYLFNNRNATSSYNFAKFFSGYPDNTQDVEFVFRGDGTGYSDGGWTTPASDYAEYFESVDGTSLQVGSTVVLENGKIRQATESDTNIIGAIRPKNASLFLGNNAEFKWNQKYLKDEFGAYILDVEGMRTLNPQYNSKVEYISREKRDEWNIVGIVGQIPILKSQPVGSNWIKMYDVSSTVEMWLIK
jgi:hypothetical protein